MKVYHMFLNPQPPDDFVKKILRNRKDTADELFESIANLDFKDDAHDKHEEYAVKNYPVPNKATMEGQSKDTLEDGPFSSVGPRSKGGFFSENLTLSEIEQLQSAPQTNINQVSPVYFVNQQPPGLTPTRQVYHQKTYTHSEMTPVQ